MNTKPPSPALTPEDLMVLKKRLSVDRPLHWDAARALIDALEAAWRELGRLPPESSAVTSPTALSNRAESHELPPPATAPGT
jgi:hypothetical protein